MMDEETRRVLQKIGDRLDKLDPQSDETKGSAQLKREREAFIGDNFASLYAQLMNKKDRQAKIITRIERSRRDQRAYIQRLRYQLMTIFVAAAKITKVKLEWTTEPVEVYDPIEQTPAVRGIMGDLGYKDKVEVARVKNSMVSHFKTMSRR